MIPSLGIIFFCSNFLYKKSRIYRKMTLTIFVCHSLQRQESFEMFYLSKINKEDYFIDSHLHGNDTSNIFSCHSCVGNNQPIYHSYKWRIKLSSVIPVKAGIIWNFLPFQKTARRAFSPIFFFRGITLTLHFH